MARADCKKLEERFLVIWQSIGGPELVREYRFAPPRRWRFDFAHLPTRVAVEVHGSVFSDGRHTRGAGFLADREKMLAAQRAGWLVVEFGTGFTLSQVEEVLDVIVERGE